MVIMQQYLFRKNLLQATGCSRSGGAFFRLINCVKLPGCGMVIGRKMIEEKE